MEERRETEKIEAAEQTAVKPAGTEQTAVNRPEIREPSLLLSEKEKETEKKGKSSSSS